MKILYLILFITAFNPDAMVIFDYNSENSIDGWRVVDDVVMGGRSAGNIAYDSNALKFYGRVSLENNGGFSSIRYNYPEPKSIDGREHIKLELKGDGQVYQLRLKNSLRDYQSYVYDFQTSGEWETIEIELSELAPQFRGRRLNMPNFNFSTFEELGFLIANKQVGEFELKIRQVAFE